MVLDGESELIFINGAVSCGGAPEMDNVPFDLNRLGETLIIVRKKLFVIDTGGRSLVSEYVGVHRFNQICRAKPVSLWISSPFFI